MEIILSIAGLRPAVVRHGLLIILIATAAVMSAQHVQAADPPSPCNSGIQNCRVVTTDTIALNPWVTRAFDVYCPPKTPYYRAWTAWRSSDWIGNYFWDIATTTNYAHFTATNWDPGQAHGTRVSIACSTEPSPSTCFQPKDPGCRIVDGTSELICPDENCGWSIWEETCPDGRHWYCNTALFVPCCYTRPPGY